MSKDIMAACRRVAFEVVVDWQNFGDAVAGVLFVVLVVYGAVSIIKDYMEK